MNVIFLTSIVQRQTHEAMSEFDLPNDRWTKLGQVHINNNTVLVITNYMYLNVWKWLSERLLDWIVYCHIYDMPYHEITLPVHKRVLWICSSCKIFIITFPCIANLTMLTALFLHAQMLIQSWKVSAFTIFPIVISVICHDLLILSW